MSKLYEKLQEEKDKATFFAADEAAHERELIKHKFIHGCYGSCDRDHSKFPCDHRDADYIRCGRPQSEHQQELEDEDQQRAEEVEARAIEAQREEPDATSEEPEHA